VNLATFILIPLLAGYSFSITWYGSKYFTVREQGYRLYFRVAFYGLWLLISAVLIHLILISHFDDYIEYLNSASAIFLNANEQLEQGQIALLSVAVITIVLGPTLGHLLNAIPWSKGILYLATANEDFERLILQAVRKSMPICITMSNKKVYVGYVIRSIDPQEKRTAIRILPLISGYRTEEGLIKFNISYHEVYEQVAVTYESEHEDDELAHLEFSDFEKVLPYDEIQCSHLFDIRAYLAFQHDDGDAAMKAAASPYKSAD